MINVLQIVDGKSIGGIVILMQELNKHISKSINFNFLTATNICDDWDNLNISRKTLLGKLKYNWRLIKYLNNNKYDIVHINSGAFLFTFQVVIICKLSKIKNIVVHSHNTPKIAKYKRILIKLLNPLYNKLIDVKLSCSKEAAKSLFTKMEDVKIIKNGIDIEKFKYNENYRQEYRKTLNIENNIVYGHVGRLEKQKNHEFLIDLFYEIQKIQSNAVLLLIGSGQLEKQIKVKVHNLNIESKIVFLGFREDIDKLLNCMDIFIFPSLYEGLGISAIEAQTSGLPIFVSNGVPDETKISSNYYKFNSFDKKEWVKQILKTKIYDRNKCYINTIKAGYDIKTTCESIERIYMQLIK